MAYTRINAYDADCFYPSFAGLSQYGDGIDTDPRFSPDASNLDTPAGVLQPFARNTAFKSPVKSEGQSPPIQTLMHLYDRANEKDLLIAAVQNELYWIETGAAGVIWTKVQTEGGAAFQSGEWSWVTYENEGQDVLLISNAKDGMFSLSYNGGSMSAEAVDTSAEEGEAPYKFGVIERYAERIWGGAIEDAPDTLVYSAPFKPMDWKKADQTIPENGAGEVNQPSWDGDAFTALRSFGSQLIAFKRTRVWRVLGTSPGNYEFREQYGGGMPYANTIAVDAERIYGLTDQGVVVYDGNTVDPFLQTQCCDIWRRMTKSALNQSAACLFRGKYYIAFPIDGSTINNAVVVYNSIDGTWLLRNDITVESFLTTENALYYTNSSTPGLVWRWNEDAWQTGIASTAPCRWVTPWQDLGYKRMNKGPFKVYLLAEVKDKPAVLKISLQTDKRMQTKEIRIDPQLEWEHKKNESAHQKIIHFTGECRRFRLIIETEKEQPVWRLTSGLMVVCDVSSD